MSYSTKNKFLLGLLVLLLLANIATITVFWLGRGGLPMIQKGPPTDYLIKELGFDTKQKDAFLILVQQHRTNAEILRQKIKKAKDAFFKLLQQPGTADSVKISAAKNISQVSEQLDLITFDHFQKVRALCNADQQKKFDSIIQDVMRTIGGPEQNNMHRPPRPEGMPPGQSGDGPPGIDVPPPPHP